MQNPLRLNEISINDEISKSNGKHYNSGEDNLYGLNIK